MLSSNLKKYRNRFNYTQQQVADKIGVTRPAYTAYEKGTRNPDSAMLSKLADVFDVTIDELLGREPKQHSADEFDVFMFEDKEAFDALPEKVKQELIKEINEKIEFLAYKQKNKDK
ncbi:helix-turn-helix transcriptional regulator [Jeotgalicoccus huakuii]|nr:helix-turn-helix transcriptional regulator [Jeotgalicoccus huakuii]